MTTASFKDRTGQRFGRLVVKSRAPNTARGSARWNCVCDCGTEKVVPASPLAEGKTVSCGCLMREHTAQLGFSHTSHGATRGGASPEYSSWSKMKARCYRPSYNRWHRYGGRGIVVCDRWRDDFPTFLADMGPKPSPSHSLDRIDNDGNYEPSNCRWADAAMQARNRSTNQRVTFAGESLTVAEWARRLGCSHNCVKRRLARLSVEDALTGSRRARR